MIDSKIDEAFEDEAIHALEKSLLGCKFSCETDFAKEELTKLYFESRDLIRSNPDNERLFSVAEAIFITCIRITRCICLESELANETIINGNEYTLDAESLIDNVRSNYKHFRRLLGE
ncbi:hypothetical protein [Desulfoluna butyratoxydans]|uniref:hypothetical protein n=1 Tax=Desulfoluna butyratoxydans TaxID=231438 RepID=UPI0015D154C0|nr:hypothetical protein [Desulfoluna butyratoxydans]